MNAVLDLTCVPHSASCGKVGIFRTQRCAIIKRKHRMDPESGFHFWVRCSSRGSMNAEEIVSRLLYRDALMLVIDKPAGLPVHPGPKGGETLFHHLDALRFGLPRRPEAAHRLDKDTSGCLVLGRHPKAIARLNELFRKNEVDKVYWAVVEGGPQADEGEIDLPLAPKSPERGWWMKVDPKGQPSLTQWRVLGRGGWPHPARTAPDHRPHPSAAGPLRRHELADPRRSDLRHGPALRRPGPASCTRGASPCRSIRRSRRSPSRRRCRSICGSGCKPAASSRTAKPIRDRYPNRRLNLDTVIPAQAGIHKHEGTQESCTATAASYLRTLAVMDSGLACGAPE